MEQSSADDIEIMDGSGPVAIRMRPLLWVADLSATGLHRLAAELAEAAVELLRGNNCSSLRLVIDKDGSLTLIDDGKGLPVGQQPARWIPIDPRSVLDIAVTELFAGGPPDASFFEQYGYLVLLGPTVNGLSEAFDVTTNRDGVTYRCRYARGEVVEPTHAVGPASQKGTTVHLRPDPTLWDEPFFSGARLEEAIRPVAARYPDVAITLSDEETAREIRLL